uniref:Uncharacterized protein n=1 Tax=Solanum lycopersicum TaxID=4081 RepID=A0A3Q7F7S1_SOLLC
MHASISSKNIKVASLTTYHSLHHSIKAPNNLLFFFFYFAQVEIIKIEEEIDYLKHTNNSTLALILHIINLSLCNV